MAHTGPWDEADEHSSYDRPVSAPSSRRGTLRVSHLRQPPPRSGRLGSASLRPRMSNGIAGSHVTEKVEDLAASLQATSEVLSTADRMLEHYRDINVEQDEEIEKLRTELEKSADLLRKERSIRRRRLPATPTSSQSEDEPMRPRRRGSVRFNDDISDLQEAMMDLKSEQNRLSGQLGRQREDPARLEDPRSSRWDGHRIPNGGAAGSRNDPSERERLLRELHATEEASRKQAEVLVKGLDAERDVLHESQRLATERERELETLRHQLQAAQKSQEDEIEGRLREIQQEMRSERESWERKQQDVSELASELRNVRSLLDEANGHKLKDEIKSVASELETERRALEESHHEKRVLGSRVNDLSSRLEEAERERRQVVAELEAAVKRIDQFEGGKTALVEQAEQMRNQLSRAEQEKKEMIRQVEEYRAQMEENEALRKRLQGRLETLSREVDEGHGNKERLLQQMEVLRGQVAKGEREKEEIIHKVSKVTRGVNRRQSLGPSDRRRSLGRVEAGGAGTGDVAEMRRNLDRVELDLDRENRGLGRADFDQFYDGRRAFARDDMDRQSLMENLEMLNQDIDRKEDQQEKLLVQMRDLLTKYEDNEGLKKQVMGELEVVSNKLKESSKEVERLSEQLGERDKLLRDSERKRAELKNKALQSIKDYRTKCKRLEREAEQGRDAVETNGRLERELREMRSMATIGGQSGGSFVGSSRREIDDLTEQRHRLNDELASKNAEIRELQAVRYTDERDLAETKKLVEKLEAELRVQQTQASAVNLEKMKLEESMQAVRMSKTKDADKLEAVQRKQEEQKAELEAGMAEHKKEIKELRGKIARLVSKLQQEATQRQELEGRVLDTREQEQIAKEEGAALYSQLQQERDAHTGALRELQEQIQSLTLNHEQAMQELNKKTSKEKSDLEGQMAEIKLQLADERSTIKALRKRQDKDREEIERLNSELNVATEENSKLRSRYEQAKEDCETVKENVEVSQARLRQLEDSLRRSQYALEKATEMQQAGLQKVDDQLDRIIDQLCKETDTPLPSLLASGTIRNDPQQWIADMMGKLRWLSEELKIRLSTERRLREQTDWSQKRIRDLIQKADEDKEYFVSELDKQSMLLDEVAAQKRGLESKHKHSAGSIKALQDRIAQLTNHLETSTRALHATAEALEDKERVLEEFNDLQGEKKERDEIHDRYVRYKEKVGSLRRELQGAKSMAEDYKQETIDAGNMSSRLMESLDRISSPKAKQRKLQFPNTPPTNLRPSTDKPSKTEWSPSSDNSTMSALSDNESPSNRPEAKSERKRSYKSQGARTPGRITLTDLDNKDRSIYSSKLPSYVQAERD